MLRLSVLGRVDLRNTDGTAVRSLLAQPKALAVLAYLLLARPREFQRRERLCALFWPEADETHARGALSQALSRIRRALGKDMVESRGQEEVRIAPDRIACDALEFQEAVASESWSEAFDHYRGPLLQGFLVPGADGFERWKAVEGRRLGEMAAAAAWALALGQAESGSLLTAEQAAQRALRLDPTRESPVREYMMTLARAGDRGGALRFYEILAGLLEAELQVEPSPETSAVAARIRNGDPQGMAASPFLPDTRGPPWTAPPGCGSLPCGDNALPPGWDNVLPQSGDKAVPQSGDNAVSPARENPPLGPRPRRWRWLIPGMGAVALVLAAGYGVASDRRVGGFGTLFWNRQAEWYATAVVADFRAPFDPPIGRLASDCLKIALDQSPLVRPASHQAVVSTLARMRRDPDLALDEHTAHEIAVRDGHALVVVGEMEDVGPGYLLTARLEAAGTREVLGQFRAVAHELEELLPSLDRLAADIRKRIGDSRRSIRLSRPLEQVTTHSLAALRLYTEAERIRAAGGDPWEAVPLFQEAARLDPGFAMAYRQWGKVLNSYQTQWERQGELARLAYEHRDRMSDYERLLVEAAYVFQQEGGRGPGDSPPDACDRWGPVLRLYQDYVRQHPNDVRPLQNLGYNLDRMGRFQEAEDVYRRGVELSPTVGLYNNLVVSHLRQGEREKAMTALQEWRQRFGEGVWWLLALGSDADRRRDHGALDSIYRVYEAKGYGLDSKFLVARGRLEAVQGRMSGARAYFRQAIEAMEKMEDFVAPVPWIADLALMRLIAVGDSMDVTRDVVTALGRIPPGESLEGAWVNVGLLFALSGDLDPAREVADSLIKMGYFGSGIFESALALAEGRPEESLRILEESDSPCEGNPSADHRMDRRWRRVLAGRAYEALGDADSAMLQYQAYFTEPPRALQLNLDAIFLFDTLERLARLHEARGEMAEAIACYKRAADLWKDADPDLQHRVRWVREQAKRPAET